MAEFPALNGLQFARIIDSDLAEACNLLSTFQKGQSHTQMADGKQRRRRWLWKLKVRLRTRSIGFKLNLAENFPSWKLHRLSLLLRFRKHEIRFESESGVVVSKLKSRSRSIRNLILPGFLRRRKQKEDEPLVVNSWKTLIQMKVLGGNGIHGSPSLVVMEKICWLLEKLRSGKWRGCLLVLAAVVTATSSSFFSFNRLARIWEDVHQALESVAFYHLQDRVLWFV